ncbi:uncharacterized protein LOC135825909 [Sycon ciliatum]|uniref:uncharacterized protein LOC135825909 n=1 Tax=Sycon ciliatum TaxID=27933 RepID=UPI0031F6D9FA
MGSSVLCVAHTPDLSTLSTLNGDALASFDSSFNSVAAGYSDWCGTVFLGDQHGRVTKLKTPFAHANTREETVLSGVFQVLETRKTNPVAVDERPTNNIRRMSLSSQKITADTVLHVQSLESFAVLDVHQCHKASNCSACRVDRDCVWMKEGSCTAYEATGVFGVNCPSAINQCNYGRYPCHPDATCTASADSYTCQCKAGYHGDGKTCTDINECSSLGTNNCHSLATCTNTPGSFTCACKTGYHGDGVKCQDINECSSFGTNNCHSLATCTNTGGSFTCACTIGHYGDGVTCEAPHKCERSCTEISALPAIRASPAKAAEICRSRRSIRDHSANSVASDRRQCVSDYFQATDIPAETYWTSTRLRTANREFVASTGDWFDQTAEYLVLCEFEVSTCKRTVCKATCSDISMFQITTASAHGADKVCQKNLKTFGHSNFGYTFAHVASKESEIFGCVSRHLHENKMTRKCVYGGYGTAPNGQLKSNYGLLKPWRASYVVCEYRKWCSATCQLTRLQDNNTVTVSYTQRVNYIPTRLGVNYTEARDGCHALSMTLPTTHEKECVNYYLTKNLGTGGSGWITPKDVPVNSVPKYGLASRPLPDGTDLFIPSNRKFMIHICLGPRLVLRRASTA